MAELPTKFQLHLIQTFTLSLSAPLLVDSGSTWLSAEVREASKIQESYKQAVVISQFFHMNLWIIHARTGTCEYEGVGNDSPSRNDDLVLDATSFYAVERPYVQRSILSDDFDTLSRWLFFRRRWRPSCC
jgi:hypothetical protein